MTIYTVKLLEPSPLFYVIDSAAVQKSRFYYSEDFNAQKIVSL